MNTEELQAEVAKIKWWHRMDLGHGIVTPGIGDTPAMLARLDFPKSLRGKTVLDIGAWDGFYSFEAERRGANRVVAVDSFVWQGQGGGSKAGFELAHRVLNSKVEDRELEVLDVSPETVGIFDVVLFLGILYHMRHPLLALEKVFSVTREMVILETHVDLRTCSWPAMRFYPAGELGGDGSNWWGPNPAAVETMLQVVGFRKVKTIGLYPFDKEQGRLIMHAWR